jgi:hypothetical protein
MRLMFIYNLGDDVGSAQTIDGYSRAAKALGHEVIIYRTPPGAEAGLFEDLRSSLDVESSDAVIFVLEWWLDMQYAGHLNLVRLMAKIPRERRIVIDNDGMYNDAIRVDGDYNHPDEAGSRARTALYDSIADRILQPTLHPLRRNVRSFLFHGYNPAWEVPLDFRDKQYGMRYVGNNWFRWQAMRRVLDAVEPIRAKVGRIGLVGYAWDPPAHWVEPKLRQQACYTDPDYLRTLAVEVMPAIPFRQVITAISTGIFCPVLLRPVFNRLRLVNPRLFETCAANTIPVFALDPAFVSEICGEDAVELVLPEDRPEQKILEIASRPERYVEIVSEMRRHLAENHSYRARLEELINIVKN